MKYPDPDYSKSVNGKLSCQLLLSLQYYVECHLKEPFVRRKNAWLVSTLDRDN